MTHTEPETEPDTDLVAVVLADHRRFEAAFAEVERGTGRIEDRKDLVDHVIAEIVRHEAAKEQFLYPAVRSHLPDGDAIADRALESHAAAELVMKELEGLPATDPRFEGLVALMIEDVRRHLAEEEAVLLPRLRASCDDEHLQDLGFRVMAAKEFAPTRPHPHTPDRPPANLILGPGVGFIDKIRDTLAHREV